MTARRASWLAAFAALCSLPAPASACGCGDFRGSVVARGKAPSGQPWRIKAGPPITDSLGRRAVEFYFSVGPSASYESAGYFIGMGLPVPRRFVLRADTGIDLYGENDLSGVVQRRAVLLVVGLSTGKQLRLAPRLAPEALLRRLPWLRGLRFFDEFFPRDATPVWLRALDADGNSLGGARSYRGLLQVFHP